MIFFVPKSFVVWAANRLDMVNVRRAPMATIWTAFRAAHAKRMGGYEPQPVPTPASIIPTFVRRQSYCLRRPMLRYSSGFEWLVCWRSKRHDRQLVHTALWW